MRLDDRPLLDEDEAGFIEAPAEEWQAQTGLAAPLNAAEVVAARVVEALRPTRVGLGALLVKLERLCRAAALAAESRNVVIASLLSDRLELTTPLPVHVEWDGHQCIASSRDVGVFGVGEDENTALDDLRLALVEFYFDLKDEPVGDRLGRRRTFLSSVVREKG